MLGARAEIYSDNALGDEVNRMCLADSRLFLPGLNLAYTDRASMAASVEVRVPFVDPLVARAAFSVPGRDKIRRQAGQGRAETCRRGLATEGDRVAEGAVERRYRAWVRDDLKDVIQDVLVRGELVDSGMLRRGALSQLIADDQAGREDRSKQIWQLLTLELWYRHAQSMGVAS